MPDEPLTAREQQVLALLCAGCATSKEIGKRLGVSARTVDVHRGNLLRKFGARNAVALVAKALREERAAA